MIFVAQAGRNRHEHICEALELFGTEVLPEFAERADGPRRRSSSGWRRRWRPPSPAAEPARVVDPDYSFPAVMKP